MTKKRIKNTPKTIALIPDGNRRWATSHALSIMSSYDLGVKKFISFSEWCQTYGINNVSVWALSTENLKRNDHEVSALFNIYKKAANDPALLTRLHNSKTGIRIIGNQESLPKDLRAALNKLEDNTKKYKTHIINILVGYGGKDDILNAVKKLVAKVKDASRINEQMFRKMLVSAAMPDVDLVIRTSGEQRTSGFMPWQTSYSELYFSKKLWPDFTKNDLHKALLDYNKRQRRFGK